MTGAYSQEALKTRTTLNLASLYEISNIIGASYDLSKLLNLVLKTTIEQMQADSGSLMLLDYSTQELYIAAYKGISKKIAQRARIKVGEIVAGVAAKTKKPLLIHNKNFYSIFGKKPRPGLKSSLCIPLMVSDKFIGVINLNRIPGHKEYTERDLKAILKFANESSIAIHNAKLYIEAEQKIQHLFRFNVISCALNSVLDEEKLIDVLTECVCELFVFDIYSLLLIVDNRYRLIIRSHNKIDKKTISHLKNNLALLVSGLKKEKTGAEKIKAAWKKIKGYRSSLRYNVLPRHINSVLNAPVIAKSKTLGMLSIYSTRKGSFGQKDQQALTTLANQAAVAFDNSDFYKRLENKYFRTINALAQAVGETLESMSTDMPCRKAYAEEKIFKLLKKFSPDELDSGIVDIFLKSVKKHYAKVK